MILIVVLAYHIAKQSIRVRLLLVTSVAVYMIVELNSEVFQCFCVQ